MTTPHPDDRAAAIEAVMDAVRANVDEHGWHSTGVFADPDVGDPPFAYTVGLARTFDHHPELVIAGLPAQQGQRVLVAAVRLIEDGDRFADGDERDRILRGFTIRFRLLDLTVCNLTFGTSDAYYGHRVPRLQLLWPDPAGRFPGDPECDARMAAAQRIGG